MLFRFGCHPQWFGEYLLPSSSPKVSVGDLSLCNGTITTNNRFPTTTLGNDKEKTIKVILNLVQDLLLVFLVVYVVFNNP